MKRIWDPLYFTEEERREFDGKYGKYRTKDIKDKVEDINEKRFRGLRFAQKVLKVNAMEDRMPWELWLADTPVRAVIIFGATKQPWEPGTIMLDHGKGFYFPSMKDLKREYRRICLASAYYSQWKDTLFKDDTQERIEEGDE